MKNVLWFVFFIAVCGYADRPRFDNEKADKPKFDNEEDESDIVKVLKLIIKYGGIEKNKEEIQKKSSYLLLREREFLYNKNRKKGAAYWSWANFYGIGSFLQGDIKGGIIVAGLEFGPAMVTSIAEAHNTSISDWVGVPLVGVPLMSGYIYGIVAPILYQSKYNKTLREALNLNDKISFSIDPLIIPKDRAPAVGLAFNLRY